MADYKKYNTFDKSYLDKYNKNQIDRKMKFFENFTLDSYSQLIKNLNFTIHSKEPNFKFGKRLILLNHPIWISSDSDTKKIKIRKFNPFSRTFYSEEILADVKLGDYYRHCVGSRMPKRKLSHYYKNKDWYKGYDDAFINLYHCHNKTCGTTIKKGSNVIFFDLDQHNTGDCAMEKFDNLIKVLQMENKDILFFEQNIFNGGIHFAIKVPFHVENQKFYAVLKKRLKDEGIDVDCNFYNTILRFPLSYEYNPCDVNKLEEKDFCRFNDDKQLYLQNCFINTYDDFIKSIDFNKIVHSEFLQEIYNETVEHIIIKPIKKEKNQYWSSNIRVFEPSKLKINLKDRVISLGNRYDNMSLIVPECVQKGFTLEETADYILSIDTGSKDLKKWQRRGLINNIKKYYNKCKDNPRKSYLSNFITNQYYIPENIRNILDYPEVMDRLVNGLKNEYMKERKKHCNQFTFSDSKLKNIAIQFPFIIREVIGSYYFQISNQENKKSKYIDKRFIQYDGFQLSDTHFRRIINESKKLDGLDELSSSYSVQYLKKGILNLLQLSIISLDNKRINWAKGFCKSYELSLVKIFSFIKTITDSLKGLRRYNKITKYLFLYINDYILLNGLQGLQPKLKKIEQDWYKNCSINAPPTG